MKFKIISNVIRIVMGTESWKVSGVLQILKALNVLAPTFAAFDRLENFRGIRMISKLSARPRIPCNRFHLDFF